MTQRALNFGSFELLPDQRVLLEEGKPLRLGSRAFDILALLTERAGQLVSKSELLAGVWPGSVVEEATLRVHIAALRSILRDGRDGNRYITNIAGRGYCFVAPVQDGRRSNPISIANRTSGLPALRTNVTGRAAAVTALAAKVAERRFVTIVGQGGIGKTTVALVVAEALLSSYGEGVTFVDLAPIRNPLLVPSTLASALGLAIPSADPIPGLVAYLTEKQMLIVFDSCEHVVEEVASLAESISMAASGVHILATSREPLRAEGEWVHRLLPLEVPPASSRLSTREALAFPAVQLFVERATASLDSFALTESNSPVVASICRRLDGIPLAIELVAARVDAIGVLGLPAFLDDQLRLLTSAGRRTSQARHRTLQATWTGATKYCRKASKRSCDNWQCFQELSLSRQRSQSLTLAKPLRPK